MTPIHVYEQNIMGIELNQAYIQSDCYTLSAYDGLLEQKSSFNPIQNRHNFLCFSALFYGWLYIQQNICWLLVLLCIIMNRCSWVFALLWIGVGGSGLGVGSIILSSNKNELMTF